MLFWIDVWLRSMGFDLTNILFVVALISSIALLLRIMTLFGLFLEPQLAESSLPKMKILYKLVQGEYSALGHIFDEMHD